MVFQIECEKLVDLQIAVIWLNLPLLESIKVINLFPDLEVGEIGPMKSIPR